MRGSPFADVGPIKIENDLPDDKVLFLSDIFPTGYMGAENCQHPARAIPSPCGDADRWVCLPIASAYMLGRRTR